jgi:spermidine synthase
VSPRVDAVDHPSLLLYLSVGLVAGSVIALQIAIMRIFAVGSWAHFGSLVVSLAMFGFGLASAVMCVGKDWFETHWRGVIATALLAFGPLMVASNLVAQQVPFNAIFLVADPTQAWRLVLNFVLYFLPFAAGAFYLGTVFLRMRRRFHRVYFADLVGSGLCGLLVLGAMYVLRPADLIVAPLLLWLVGGLLWFAGLGDRRGAAGMLAAAVLAFGAHGMAPALGLPKLAVSDYKGVAYARKFPDAERVVERYSPFGYLEVYGSSYLHFAPGLSDNAAFDLPAMPDRAYLGLYVDGEGPSGIMKDLPPSQLEYVRYLPMFYPYVLKKAPETFVVQFGGGISTVVALKAGAGRVTVAEGNPMVLAAFRESPALREFTGDILRQPRVRVIDYDGRLYLAGTRERYDVIDLSLADSTGLSSPGGFAITERFSYTREALASAMRALRGGGILSVTVWNKEEPPKAVLKLYATMAAAARDVDGPAIGDRFFAVSSYLSTVTVLYKRGGFTPADVLALRRHTRAMSFDEVYVPGASVDLSETADLFQAYRDQFFGDGEAADPTTPADAGPASPREGEGAQAGAPRVPSVMLGRIAWHHLVAGDWDRLAAEYVFDISPLSNQRPYFAAYIRPRDLPRFADRLETVQDEWGYLLLWATLGIAGAAALVLVLVPLIFGWRTVFARYPGKLGTMLYFLCLGLGYIVVEVGLIGHFMRALGNATVSASVLLTGMLVFSGFGSFASGRWLDTARRTMPKVFLAIGAILIAYAFFLDPVLDRIGTLSYGLRIALCLAIIVPPAFLMGTPMPTGMGTLARLGKDHMFLWAWGINGCFSVLGAAVVPIVSTSLGLPAVILVGAAAYLTAIPAFLAVLRPFDAPVGATAERPVPA